VVPAPSPHNKRRTPRPLREPLPRRGGRLDLLRPAPPGPDSPARPQDPAGVPVWREDLRAAHRPPHRPGPPAGACPPDTSPGAALRRAPVAARPATGAGPLESAGCRGSCSRPTRASLHPLFGSSPAVCAPARRSGRSRQEILPARRNTTRGAAFASRSAGLRGPRDRPALEGRWPA
jgi:hypothetical protein